jgi:TRAP-type C4-dicarboxylate transport system substrate-binding protein
MKRIHIGLVFALALLFSTTASASYVLKLHTFVSPNSAEFRQTLMPWIERVEKASNGQIRFDVYPSMAAGGKPEELFDQAKDGKVDIVWTRPTISGKQFSRLQAFELPFIVTDPQAVSRAYWEFAQTYAADTISDVHILALHTGGPTVIHTRSAPVNDVSRMKNMRVGTTDEQSANLLSALGAKPVLLPSQATLAALTERKIDGVLAPWDEAASAGLNASSMFHTEFDTHALNAQTYMLAMNVQTYRALPEDIKKALDGDGGLETSAQFGQTYNTRNQHLRAESGANSLVTLGEQPATQFKKAAATVEAQWVKKVTADGFDGQKLLDGARTLIKQHTK